MIVLFYFLMISVISFSETIDLGFQDIEITGKKKKIISRKIIEESGTNSVSELLVKELGIYVKKGFSGNRVVDIRGFGDTSTSNTKILINNIPINSIDSLGVRLDSISLEEVERIEIITGGASVLYGDNATGGVINIKTKKKSKDNININSNISSLGKKIGVGFSAEKGGHYANSLLKYDDEDGYRENSQSELKNISFSGGKENVFDIRYSWYEDSFGLLPGSLDSLNNPEESFNLEDNGSQEKHFIAGNYKVNVGKNNLDFNIGYINTKDKANFYTNLYNVNNKTSTINFGIKDSIKYDLGNILLGLDFYKNEIDFENTYSQGKNNKISYSAYFLNDIEYKNINLKQGFRYEVDDYQNYDKYNNQAYFISAEKDFDFGKLGLNYDRSFRTPNVDELSYSNFEIVPQTSDSLEIEYNKLGEKYLLKLKGFYLEADNEIYYDPNDNFGFGSNKNFEGTTKRIGFELYSKQYIGNLTLHESVRLMDNKISKGIYENNEIPGVPKAVASLGASYDINNKIQLSSDVIYTGSYYAYSDFENKTNREDHIFLANLLLNYKVNEKINIALGVDNVFNKVYSTYTGYSNTGGKYYYPGDGRNYKLNFSMKL